MESLNWYKKKYNKRWRCVIIIIDFSQVMLSNLLVNIGAHTNIMIQEDLLRHMVLNCLRSYNQKFGAQFGEIVIACDSRSYWRKSIFPHYKFNRKKSREQIDLDWPAVFRFFDKIKSEIKEQFPYRVIEVEGAEADDIIATLVLNPEHQNILILSGDKDFIQLHYHRIKQYDPVRKKWVRHNNPLTFLKEHIIKGDAGDGIPNIRSSDNVFVIGEKQKPITKKILNNLIENNIEAKFDHQYYRNYVRNKQLIDLTCIPDDIKEKIQQEYNSQENKSRKNMFNYFMTYKLKHLMENITDF